MTAKEEAIEKWKNGFKESWHYTDEEVESFSEGWDAALAFVTEEKATNNPLGFQFVQANVNNLWKGIVLKEIPAGTWLFSKNRVAGGWTTMVDMVFIPLGVYLTYIAEGRVQRGVCILIVCPMIVLCLFRLRKIIKELNGNN